MAALLLASLAAPAAAGMADLKDELVVGAAQIAMPIAPNAAYICTVSGGVIGCEQTTIAHAPRWGGTLAARGRAATGSPRLLPPLAAPVPTPPPQYVHAAGTAGIKLLAFARGVLDEASATAVAKCAGDAGVNVILTVYTNSKNNKATTAATFFMGADGKVASRKSVLKDEGGTGKDLFVVEMEGAGKVCSLLGDEGYNLLSR